MADDPKQRGKPDRGRISIRQVFERRDWAKKFGITQDQLKLAVKKAGQMVADVKAWLIERIEKA